MVFISGYTTIVDETLSPFKDYVNSGLILSNVTWLIVGHGPVYQPVAASYDLSKLSPQYDLLNLAPGNGLKDQYLTTIIFVTLD